MPVNALRAAVAALVLLAADAAQAEALRIATFNAELTRRNPGLLVRDLMKGNDAQVDQVVEIIQRSHPDILLLTGLDHDAQGVALGLLRERLETGLNGANGIEYAYWFLAPVNTGVPSGLDLDGDGRIATADDAWGFGYFAGQEGMAILSRYPVDLVASRTFQSFRWGELPNALMPVWLDGSPFPDALVQASTRLSAASHWDVTVDLPQGPVHLLAAHPAPPVFDGPEDANGKRNHDEIVFWTHYLDGAAFRDDQGRMSARADGPVVVLGDFNADPVDGDGLHDGIAALLAHGLLSDPMPVSLGGTAASLLQNGVNALQLGDPALDTADWEDVAGKPGNMRVDYVLPSRDFTITGSGVFWPPPGDPLHGLVVSGAEHVTQHRLVWVDISR